MAKFKKKKSEAIIETSVIPTKHVKGRPRIANTSSYLALQKVLYGMSKYIQKYTANIGIEGQKLEDFNMRIADKLMRGDRDEFAVSKVLMKTLKLVVVHINKQVFETTKKMLVTLTVHDVTVSGEIYIIQCENKTQLMRMYDISSNIKKWKEKCIVELLSDCSSINNDRNDVPPSQGLHRLHSKEKIHTKMVNVLANTGMIGKLETILGSKLKCNAIVNNETVELNLDGRELEDEDIIALSTLLKINNSIEVLSLNANNIQCKGAMAIADLLNKTNIAKLYLQNNYISDDGANALGDALKTNFTLRELSLHNNNIKDDGAIALTESLKRNHGLENLFLNKNEITKKSHFYITNVQNLREARVAQQGGKKLKIWASFNIFHDVIKTTSNDKLKRGIRSVMVMNRFKGTRGRTSSGD